MIPDINSVNPLARMGALHEAAWRYMEEQSSSARALGATTVSRGNLTVDQGGNIILRDGGNLTLSDSGQIEILDPSGAGHVFRVTGDGGLTTVDRTTGRGAYLFGGNLRFYPDVTGDVQARIGTADDGFLLLTSPTGIRLASDATATINAQGMLFLTGDQIQLNATGSNGISMYGTPTTSSAANMFLGTVGGQWQVARSTSSRRYKQDVETHDVDVEGVKAWQRSRWVDIYDAEHVEVPFAPREHVGFIAEQIHEHTPEFVVCDGEGEPDALEYDRMAAVGLHAWCEQLQGEVDDLKAERDTQAQQIAALLYANAALAHRLDALEADRG